MLVTLSVVRFARPGMLTLGPTMFGAEAVVSAVR